MSERFDKFLAATTILLLLVVNLFILSCSARWGRRPTAFGAQPRPAASDEIAPREMNWLLCRLMEDNAARLLPSQVGPIQDVLRRDVAYTRDSAVLWNQAERLLRGTLSTDQNACIQRYLRSDHARDVPLNQRLFSLLQQRSGVDFLRQDAHALLAAAAGQAMPAAPSIAPQLSPEDVVSALPVLESEPRLALTRAQAVAILPYVKVQFDLFDHHVRTTALIRKQLNGRQLEFISRLRRTYAVGSPPPGASDEEALRAISSTHR